MIMSKNFCHRRLQFAQQIIWFPEPEISSIDKLVLLTRAPWPQFTRQLLSSFWYWWKPALGYTRRRLWKAWLHPRLFTFSWKLVHHALPTNDFRARCRIQVQNTLLFSNYKHRPPTLPMPSSITSLVKYVVLCGLWLPLALSELFSWLTTLFACIFLMPFSHHPHHCSILDLVD